MGTVQCLLPAFSGLASCILIFIVGRYLNAVPPEGCLDSLLGVAGMLMVCGILSEGEKRVTVNRKYDAEGNAKSFTLTLGQETVSLDAGKPWAKVDEYKWVTRGLLEPPQSFHVLPDGTVEINGEKINLHEPDGIAKLEHEINKRHGLVLGPKPVRPSTHSDEGGVGAHPSIPGKVHFRVKLDHLGHLQIECSRGAERLETGLRGLNNLIINGLMLKPREVHIDPLQRAIEIDGARFECSEAGAHQLEAVLNAKYAPSLEAEADDLIEIKENPASATGFDISFVTIHQGVRLEVKGHLSQEKLDILQDPSKCDLLHPAIVLRVSPPYLLARRRTPDGGEQKIPELPDFQYRRVTASQLKKILNHPLVRRAPASAGTESVSLGAEESAHLMALRLIRHPHDRLLLWLECVTPTGSEQKAFTHHNIADLQHHGVFRENIAVSLSLDNVTLSIINKETNHKETINIDSKSRDEELDATSRILTAALKPPPPAPAQPQISRAIGPLPTPVEAQHLNAITPLPVCQGEPKPEPASNLDGSPEIPVAGERAPAPEPAHAKLTDQPEGPEPSALTRNISAVSLDAPKQPPSSPAPVASPEPALPCQFATSLFAEADPLRINMEIFRHLSARLGISAQNARLSLPPVFVDRLFEIISFNQAEIESVFELRSDAFSGFYLSHVSERKILLVYASKGKHVEWGPDQCVLEAAVNADPVEFEGNALLGLAQDAAGHFIFVVTPAYKQWVRPHEKHYKDIGAHFILLTDLLAALDHYSFIWPELTAPKSIP